MRCPGFQFIQDDLEFFNGLVEEDLQQAAVVLASFAIHAATRAGSYPHADGLNNGRRWHK